jgi:hypothetical protein
MRCRRRSGFENDVPSPPQPEDVRRFLRFVGRMTIEGMVHAEEIQWIEIGRGVPGLS